MERIREKEPCSFNGCVKNTLAKGLCAGHYHQSRRGDGTLKPLAPRSLDDETRFWHYVDKRGQDDCWPWKGGKTGVQGYGSYTKRGRSYGAHIESYELQHGEVPAGKTIDHQCRNTSCVNPAHLKAVTHAENMQNKTAYKTSKTGVRGVSPTREGRYIVNVSNGRGKNIHGGRYDTIEEAEEAAIKLRNKIYTNNVLDRR